MVTDSGEENQDWTIQSKVKSQSLSAAVFFAGAIFAYLRVHYCNSHPGSESPAAILTLKVASAFFASAAAYLFFIWETVEITVRPALKLLQVIRRNRLGEGHATINFNDVESVLILRRLRRHGRSILASEIFAYYQYQLLIRLKDGRLISTGCVSRDSAEVAMVHERLQNEIGCPRTELAPESAPPSANLITAILAVLAYTIWYRAFTGQICPAMWIGPTPLLFIACNFIFLRSFVVATLRRITKQY